MHYKKAPIQEAVFDIKVGQVANVDIEYYKSLLNSSLQEFEKVENRVQVSGQIKYDAKKRNIESKQSLPTVLGVIFSNHDDTRKVQFRKNGYSYNMLNPYTDWEEFSEEAFRYWEVYKKELRPNYIERIALRYINKINIPTNNLDFDEYINNIPDIPKILDDRLSSYFMRMVAPCKENGFEAIITETIEKPSADEVPFILDIDVYKSKKMSIEIDLKDDFNIIRKNKNLIFESLITQKTRKLFN